MGFKFSKPAQPKSPINNMKKASSKDTVAWCKSHGFNDKQSQEWNAWRKKNYK